MNNLLMLILSTITASLLIGTLYVFFKRLHRIQDDFWGHEKEAVIGTQTDEGDEPEDEDSRE